MAKTTHTNGAWVQPVEFFSTIDKNGNGKFVRVPVFPELATIAEMHSLAAASKFHDMIVRAYNSGYKETTRDRVSLFDKTFAAAPVVRQYVRDAAAAKGVATSDEAITNTILSDKYRNALVAKFGVEVAAEGYTPTKRGAKEASANLDLDL